jgi:hypothetical protein
MQPTSNETPAIKAEVKAETPASRKFHVPVMMEVTCNSLEEAQRAAYKAIDSVAFKGFRGGDEGQETPIDIVMINDGHRAKNGQRVFFLHPSDTDADYDPDEYEARLVKED